MPTKKILLFSPNSSAVSETFIRSHIEKLPYNVIPRFGVRWGLFNKREEKIFPLMFWIGRFLERAYPRLDALLFNYFLARHIKHEKPYAVLAEFGTTGAWLILPCRSAGSPLYVIFHGYDASVHSVLEEKKEDYKNIFRYSAGIIAVSKGMREKLISMGADPKKCYWSPCGVDEKKFHGASPKLSEAVLFSVGRFVEKKAPYLTILAFSKVLKEIPDSMLRMIGTGPLLGPSINLAKALGIESSVIFLGELGSDRVVDEMRKARAFVQHSLVALNGDSEGTPVAVIEAQMMGLPVVSTRHAGIPDVVIDGETGLLVEEGDVETMANSMIRLLNDPALAKRLGDAGSERAKMYFTLNQHVKKIAEIIG
jgi:colanic acid/amylovoran biosynthesis glycosyltransferase